MYLVIMHKKLTAHLRAKRLFHLKNNLSSSMISVQDINKISSIIHINSNQILIVENLHLNLKDNWTWV